MCSENCAYWFHDLGRSGKIRLFNASGKKVVEIFAHRRWINAIDYCAKTNMVCDCPSSCLGEIIIFNCAMVRSFVVVVVVVRHTQKILPIVQAAAGARACPSNGIWRICDFDFWHEKSI